MGIEKVLQSLEIERKNFKQEISLITQDSRKVQKGSLFFALRGSDELKIRNLQEAQKKEARLVIHDVSGFESGLFLESIHEVFSDSLKLFYNESFKNLKVYGVTGTNGKTTYSYMLKGMLEAYNVPTGIFGTIENSFRGNKLDTGLTSPNAEDLYAFSAENYHNHGMRALVCEVSSHALDQKRMGLSFLDGAAFTSFSQDHLDYHKDMKSYLKAKLKIKTEASKEAAYFCSVSKLKEELIGLDVDLLNDGDFNVTTKKESFGQRLEFKSLSKKQSLSGFLPMLGEYNAENFALALMTLCRHFGHEFFPDDRVFRLFASPPGRMEPVFYKDKPIAFIDYSHTPDSLEKALKTLKSLNQRVYVVFGCGGNRDKDKRAKMGKVSSSFADYSFLTSDNPRDEDPKEIINAIVSGVKGSSFEVVEKREEAISKSLDKAVKDKAVVLIAGKGHERTQEIAGVKKFFSDKEEVKKWVEENEG
jgi:UDP-N-acetylmuramoyl-L-alanyl-D-glutamate--2,6-diaminopimelate ligase